MPYSSTAHTQYGNQKLPMAIQANISGLTLFRSKFLSGKNNILISPNKDSKGYSVGRQKLQNGATIFNINVPHWETYILPLDDKDKYRIYVNGCWHESMHCKYTPDEVYSFGATVSTDPYEKGVVTVSLCPICKPSEDWLGKYAYSEKVRSSGLWNSSYVFEAEQRLNPYDLEKLQEIIGQTLNLWKRA